MASQTAGLRGCPQPLWDEYDVAMLDLDGVVYIGAEAVPDAAEHLEAARGAGMRLGFVTNNAARPPSAVAEHLTMLGVRASAGDVVTSAQAAARVLAEQLDAGAKVFVIGGAGLFAALEERGMHGVQSITEHPVAVVSGFHPELAWHTVIEGAILVREGLPWVASNTDRTVPTPFGAGPGNGVLVEAVARFADRTPLVAGKPEPPLFRETLLRIGGTRPLVVGDRLDTDIEGARNVGYDSLLVMTGVTGLAELVAARPKLRPTYVAATLGGLGVAQPLPERVDGNVALGGWRVSTPEGRLHVDGSGSPDDWWRVVAVAAWEYADATGRQVDVTGAAL